MPTHLSSPVLDSEQPRRGAPAQQFAIDAQWRCKAADNAVTFRDEHAKQPVAESICVCRTWLAGSTGQPRQPRADARPAGLASGPA